MDEEALKKSTDCVYFLASPLTCKKYSFDWYGKGFRIGLTSGPEISKLVDPVTLILPEQKDLPPCSSEGSSSDLLLRCKPPLVSSGWCLPPVLELRHLA
ncbi:hypothetical protein R1sor_020620 [Riccia sorocarpa]|uniref:Uncharacterized protein n=1 Tax=Riccia sorocarpa TaxID=122646 RepID=A0ABD3GIY0_9MARC